MGDEALILWKMTSFAATLFQWQLPHFWVTRGGFIPSWRYCMTHAGKPPDSMSPESAVLFCFFNAYCCICKRESTLRWRKQNCHLRTLADASCSSEHKVIWLLFKEAYFCLKFRSLSLSLSHTHTHTHTPPAVPWTHHICRLQSGAGSLMCMEQNSRCALYNHSRGKEGRVEEDYRQNFPCFLLSACISTFSCLTCQTGSVPVSVFLYLLP